MPVRESPLDSGRRGDEPDDPDAEPEVDRGPTLVERGPTVADRGPDPDNPRGRGSGQ